MPEICRFLGLVISMLYDDHRPPHFHAEYGEYKMSVDINTGVVDGRFPPRALRAVIDGMVQFEQGLSFGRLAACGEP